MGLDMYLTGEKFFMTDWENPQNNKTEDGYEVKAHRLSLGYWRKHPNLHGYIVNTYADGVDNCQPIELSADCMHGIIQAIKEKRLPETSGFFFGQSDGSEDEESIEIFEKAIQWLTSVQKQSKVLRSVEYQASW